MTGNSSRYLGVLAGFVLLPLFGHAQQIPVDSLTNVSYDVSRSFYQQYNPLFVSHYQRTAGRQVTISQSHGGSGGQARKVIEGLEADVVTFNSPLDVDIIARDGKALLPANWAKEFPNHAAPSWSTTLFIVRKGNPRQIRDWPDLARQGVEVIIPNPKVTGNGRYSYLAAWIAARTQPGGSDATAREFVGKVFRNVPVLDGGGRGATTTFAQRGIGDVLLTFESEAYLILKEFGADKFEIVVPSVSVRANNPVAIVQGVAAKRGSTALARAYLEYLYSDAAQDLYAQAHLRPATASAWERHRSEFPVLQTLDIETTLGVNWLQIFDVHFKDGGIYDQISVAK